MQENSIKTIEYTTIKERTPDVIATEIKTIEHYVTCTAIQGAVQIGAKLNEIKEQVGHGNFEQWCKDNLDYSKSKAERFMKITATYGDENSAFSKTSTLTDFSISKALSLLALPEEEVETFVDEHDIESMTVKELEAEIRELKAERDGYKEQAEAASVESSADEEVSRLSAQLKEAQEEIQKIDIIEQQKEAAEGRAKKAEEAERFANEKVQKAEALISSMKDEEEKKIRAAISESRETIIEELRGESAEELKKAYQEKANLESEIEKLNKKMANSTNESMQRFKVLADQLQSIFAQCQDCINNEEEEKADKMKQALTNLLNNMNSRI